MTATQVINTAQTVISALNVVLIALLTQVGCTQDPATLKLVCVVSSVPFLTVGTLGWIAGIVNALKFGLLPMLAPGGWVRNLFGDKTVVTAAPVPGTVDPSAIK